MIATLEKVVPTLDDAATLMRVLARSATGQEFSTYTTVSTGPRRPGDADGPAAFHVVLLDNGRARMLGSPFPGRAPLHQMRRLHEPLPRSMARWAATPMAGSIPGRSARC